MAQRYSQECWISVLGELHPTPTCAKLLIDLVTVEMKESFGWAGVWYVWLYTFTHAYVFYIFLKFKYLNIEKMLKVQIK